MSFKYTLLFDERALQEWNSLDNNIKIQFKKKLVNILNEPYIYKNKLYSLEFKNCYKLKLRNLGYRLVYQIKDDELIILIIAIGKKGKNKNDTSDIYNIAKHRK